MFKQQKKMTVMDFTGIYENENFYKLKILNGLIFVDCKEFMAIAVNKQEKVLKIR